MGTFYSEITEKQTDLIREAKFFFVASAPLDADTSSNNHPNSAGPINLSPKGGSSLHIINPNCVAYLDFPGSGNETAQHARAGGHITIMIMSCDQQDAAIVRLYGKATVRPVDNGHLSQQLLASARSPVFSRPRQIIEVTVSRTQTSCGYGVPILQFVGERGTEHCGRKFKDPRA